MEDENKWQDAWNQKMNKAKKEKKEEKEEMKFKNYNTN